MNHPETEDEYDTLKNTDKLIVVQFSTRWCGPCKKITPYVEELAEEFKKIVFIHIDIDILDELPDGNDVRGVPTFKFFKNNKLIDSFSGANPDKLRDTILTYRKL